MGSVVTECNGEGRIPRHIKGTDSGSELTLNPRDPKDHYEVEAYRHQVISAVYLVIAEV